MNSNGWFFLSPDVQEKINQERKSVIGGFNAKERLSPYDVPIAMRVRRSEVEKTLILDFQYISPDEPMVKVFLEGNVSVECGKNSQRIYSITIEDASAHRRDAQIEGTFEKALMTFAKKKKDSPKLRSYQAAKEALALTWEKMQPIRSSLEPQTSF